MLKIPPIALILLIVAILLAAAPARAGVRSETARPGRTLREGRAVQPDGGRASPRVPVPLLRGGGSAPDRGGRRAPLGTFVPIVAAVRSGATPVGPRPVPPPHRRC